MLLWTLKWSSCTFGVEGWYASHWGTLMSIRVPTKLHQMPLPRRRLNQQISSPLTPRGGGPGCIPWRQHRVQRIGAMWRVSDALKRDYLAKGVKPLQEKHRRPSSKLVDWARGWYPHPVTIIDADKQNKTENTSKINKQKTTKINNIIK
jgi:hypothetical protein